ncbi:MAG TPA: agmatine deiminase family protein [Bacteroidia bacterium]|nr:agmatine deiminase family protein [Bacteroidia bacterium]
MKRKYFLLLMALLPVLAFSQNTLHRISDSEKIQMPDYLRQISQYRTDGITIPPAGAVRASAEWEEIDALIVAWISYPVILKEIVRYAQDETNVFIICSDSATVKNYLTVSGVPQTRIQYIVAPFNSIWCRDYGPWNIYSDDVDSLSLIDWIYNRPRPKDDTVPSAIERHTGLPMYQTTVAPNDLIHTGGNFMTDGLGTGFSSNLIVDENPGHSIAEIDTIMSQFMGINRYIKMNTLPYDGIHHIDMHMKLLDEETILMGEYPAGVADGPGIEANLQTVLNTYNSPFGTPYKVVRIPMPPDANGLYPNAGGDYRTYANAVFVNKTVILPTYAQQYDTTALRIWREAMPGYRVVGIDCNSIIPSLGAIHCITKEVAAADPLLIVHQALHDTYNTVNDYTVDARLQHRSGIANATVYYRTDTLQPYQSSAMTLSNPGTNTWTGSIPAQAAGTTVYYYIEANAVSGKHQVRPLPAPAGYWKFNVLLNTGISSVQKKNSVFLGSVYPNPSKGLIAIPVKTDRLTSCTIEIKNVLGQTMSCIFNGSIQGERNFFANTTSLSSGIYMVELKTAEKIMQEKIVVR